MLVSGVEELGGLVVVVLAILKVSLGESDVICGSAHQQAGFLHCSSSLLWLKECDWFICMHMSSFLVIFCARIWILTRETTHHKVKLLSTINTSPFHLNWLWAHKSASENKPF